MITSNKKISCFLQGCHFSTEIFYDYSLVSYKNFEERFEASMPNTIAGAYFLHRMRNKTFAW